MQKVLHLSWLVLFLCILGHWAIWRSWWAIVTGSLVSQEIHFRSSNPCFIKVHLPCSLGKTTDPNQKIFSICVLDDKNVGKNEYGGIWIGKTDTILKITKQTWFSGRSVLQHWGPNLGHPSDRIELILVFPHVFWHVSAGIQYFCNPVTGSPGRTRQMRWTFRSRFEAFRDYWIERWTVPIANPTIWETKPELSGLLFVFIVKIKNVSIHWHLVLRL